MKIKLHHIILSTLSLLYIGSATASLVTTSYSGEVYGYPGTSDGTVSVTFTYDTTSPSVFDASATVSAFGVAFEANSFDLVSHDDHSIEFEAPVVTGTTTTRLYLYGNFYDWSPSDFIFDRRSDAVTTNNGHWSVDMDNTSAVTTAVSTVPVPAAVWLFGSGLLGLVGIARRKKV